MEIIVHQAILHVLDTTLAAPVLSGSCMEMTAEKRAYLQYHIEKLLASDDIRQCRPLPDSAFRYELEQNKDFIDLSCRIAGVLFDYMHAHTTIPGADLAVVDFTRDGQPWLGILKLNYKNGYTHYTESVDGAPVNSIIQQRACLPTQSGKVEEGALVDLTDYSMKLLEKKFDIDGHKEFYLSTVVFQYTTAEPEKKKLQAIQDAAVQAVQENYQDEPHVEAQVAMLIANQAADNDNQVSIQQVRQQLAEEYPLAAVPFDDYVEKSEVLEEAAAPVTVTPARIRRMESRSIRTANGIEVKIPTELLNSDSELEFLHDPDGSVSLLIKNVIPKHLDCISAKLVEMGVYIEDRGDAVLVRRSGPLQKTNVKTMPYPGFPTDMQPQIAAVLSIAQGTSIVNENVWNSRFKYIDELKRMGANIQADGHVAVIEGVEHLQGAPVQACDLRAGAAMVIAGLCAEGVTELSQVQFIERGYEDLVGKLRAVGADISLVDVPDEADTETHAG